MVIVRQPAKQRSIWVCLEFFAPLFASRQKVEKTEETEMLKQVQHERKVWSDIALRKPHPNPLLQRGNSTQTQMNNHSLVEMSALLWKNILLPGLPL